MEYGTYFLCTAAAALCGCLVAFARFVKRGARPGMAAAVICAAAAAGALGARLYYLAAYCLPGGGMGNAELVSDRPYEYAACGAVLGVILAVFPASKPLRMPAGRLLDAAAPGGMAALMLERIAEVFADFGWGDEILEEKWQFFPLALRDGYGDWYGAVNLLEAAAAFFVLLLALRKRRRDGTLFALTLLWWSMSQILCESLRAETLRWGFVRVQQVQCAVFGAAALLWALRRMKADGKRRLVFFAAYLSGVAAVIALEFALDRLSWPRWLDYLMMAAALSAMGMCVRGAVMRADRAAG